MLHLTSALAMLAFLGTASPPNAGQSPRFVTPATGQYSANIRIPLSSHPSKSDPKGLRYTHYLINSGPWNLPSLDDASTPAVARSGPSSRIGGISGYHPSDIQAAYKLPANGGQYAIAVIDAFNNKYALSDFNTFSRTFGLPVETSTDPTAATNQHLQVVYADGTQPAENSDWAGEIALDTQWAHAVAPNAKIYLVEAASNSSAALARAVAVANQLPGVREISMSYGSTGENSTEQTEDSLYTQSGIVYFGSTGDSAGLRGYPALSPNVVAVGGTSIVINSGVVGSLSVWKDAGAGPSSVVARPTYQNGVAGVVGNFRNAPDVCAIADPNYGVAIYDTYLSGWVVAGGTSLSAPVCAAMANVRGNFASGSVAELTRLYGAYGVANTRDVTSGSIATVNPNTNRPTGEVLTTGVGYDLASGLGELVYSNLASTTANATSMTVSSGALLAGDIANLTTVDGNRCTVASRYQNGVGQVASFDATYTLGTPSGNTVTSLVAQIDAAALPGVTMQVLAQNVTTGVFESVGSVALTTSDVASLIPFDASTYAGSTGRVTLRIQAVRPIRYGYSGFALRVDQANLVAGSVH